MQTARPTQPLSVCMAGLRGHVASPTKKVPQAVTGKGVLAPPVALERVVRTHPGCCGERMFRREYLGILLTSAEWEACWTVRFKLQGS